MKHKVVYNDCLGFYGLSDEAVEILQQRGYDYHKNAMPYLIPRHNKDLIEVVELLGEKVNIWCSKLAIYELPEGCNQYRIDSFDGMETVEHPDNVEWITIE